MTEAQPDNRVWSAETSEAIRKLREGGASYGQIGRALGKNESSIRSHCTQRGYRPLSRPGEQYGPPIPPERRWRGTPSVHYDGPISAFDEPVDVAIATVRYWARQESINDEPVGDFLRRVNAKRRAYLLPEFRIAAHIRAEQLPDRFIGNDEHGLNDYGKPKSRCAG